VLFVITSGILAICVGLAAANKRVWLAALLMGVAIYAWVRASFFAGSSFSLDGSEPLPELDSGWHAVLIPMFLGSAAVILSRKVPTLMHRFVLLLSIGVVVHASTVVSTLVVDDFMANDRQRAGLPALSQQENVIVILLDAMQSDIVADILQRRPDLESELTGFHYFPNATSDSPTTYLSLPALHSGRQYREGLSAQRYFNDSIEQHSFLSRLARSGFRSSYIRAVGSNCPTDIMLCVSAAEFQHGRIESAVDEASQLLTLGLYRIAPDFLRRTIAQERSGAFGELDGLASTLQQQVRDGLELLRWLAGDIPVDEQTGPAALFVHSLATHAPYILGPDCTPVPPRHDRTHAADQAECALVQVTRMFERLKQLGAYENSLIVIVADHGIGFESHHVESVTDARFRTLVGQFNPAIMLKMPGAGGSLVTSNAGVRVADLALALCDEQGCSSEQVLQRLLHSPNRDDRRVFDYRWQHDYWFLDEIPGAIEYLVGENMFAADAWSRRGETYVAGQEIFFAAGGDSARYLGFGWSGAEATHTWTLAQRASVFLDAALDAGQRHVLSVRSVIYGAAEQSPRRVGVSVNSVDIGELHSRSSDWIFAERSLCIPDGVLRADGDQRIVFTIFDPLIPDGPDQRELGLAVQGLTLRSAEDEPWACESEMTMAEEDNLS
jgi:hypothetical protein